MITKDLDQDTVNSIYNKFMFSSNKTVELMDKKSVVSMSNNLTSIQNAFNVLSTSILNINKLNEYKSKRNQQITREKAIESYGGSTGITSDSSLDITTTIKSFGLLIKAFDKINEKLEQLDLTQQACDIEGVVDGRRDTRARTRGRLSRGLKVGGALGVLGAGIDAADRLGEGQSLGQTAVGVGGGLAGAALGAKAGAALGAFGGPAAPITVPLGGLIGGAAGYFAGGALADRGYQAITRPELSESTFSSRFADFLRGSISNVVSFTALTTPLGIAAGAAGLVGDLFGFGDGVGSSENAEKALQFFISKGWTREQAAGIVGNLQAESTKNLNPNAFGKNDAGPGLHSYGIAQWNRDRFANLQNFAKSRGANWNDFNTQLEFIQHELNGKEKSAGNKLRGATTAEEAAAIVDQFYERSTGEHRSKRIANARTLLKSDSETSNLSAVQTLSSMARLAGFNPLGTGQFANPTLNNRTTSEFKSRHRPGHQGVDFGARTPNVDGDPIFASDGGIVTNYTGVRGAYGNIVEIDHGNGYKTRYAHLSEISVSVGQVVSRGDVIGAMGNTGRSTATHLHFEIRRNGRAINPLPLLSSSGVRQDPTKAKPEQRIDPRFMKPYDGMLLDPKKRKTRTIVVERPVYVPVPTKTGSPSRSTRAPRGSGNRSANYYTN